MSRVAELGCIVCGSPAQIHHWRENNERRNDLFIIPLCLFHHTEGTEAIHNGLHNFEMAYGTQRQLFSKVLDQLARRIK